MSDTSEQPKAQATFAVDLSAAQNTYEQKGDKKAINLHNPGTKHEFVEAQPTAAGFEFDFAKFKEDEPPEQRADNRTSEYNRSKDGDSVIVPKEPVGTHAGGGDSKSGGEGHKQELVFDFKK